MDDTVISVDEVNSVHYSFSVTQEEDRIVTELARLYKVNKFDCIRAVVKASGTKILKKRGFRK